MADLIVPVLNQQGEEVARMAVPRESLGSWARPRLIHRAVVAYGYARRSGTASTKTRGEISKSNRKPWAQKGTGRARAGSRRSPLWRGGGVIFGPKPRAFAMRMNRKQRRLAARSAFLWKLADGQVVVVETLGVDAPRTRLMAQQLARLGVNGACLVAMEAVPREVWLAARNLPGVKVTSVGELNAYDVVRTPKIVITRAALERFAASAGAKEATP